MVGGWGGRRGRLRNNNSRIGSALLDRAFGVFARASPLVVTIYTDHTKLALRDTRWHLPGRAAFVVIVQKGEAFPNHGDVQEPLHARRRRCVHDTVGICCDGQKFHLVVIFPPLASRRMQIVVGDPDRSEWAFNDARGNRLGEICVTPCGTVTSSVAGGAWTRCSTNEELARGLDNVMRLGLTRQVPFSSLTVTNRISPTTTPLFRWPLFVGAFARTRRELERRDDAAAADKAGKCMRRARGRPAKIAQRRWRPRDLIHSMGCKCDTCVDAMADKGRRERDTFLIERAQRATRLPHGCWRSQSGRTYLNTHVGCFCIDLRQFDGTDEVDLPNSRIHVSGRTVKLRHWEHFATTAVASTSSSSSSSV